MAVKKDLTKYKIENEFYLKHNYKLGESEEKDICLSYMFHQPIQQTLTKYNISEQTYYNVIKKHKKNNFAVLDKDITELRKNFSKKTSIIIDELLEKIRDQVKNNPDVNVSQLTTALGILYDKTALEEGRATVNNAVNISISVDK